MHARVPSNMSLRWFGWKATVSILRLLARDFGPLRNLQKESRLGESKWEYPGYGMRRTVIA